MKIVRPSRSGEVEAIQKIWHQKENVKFLGGPSFREAVARKIEKCESLVVEEDGQVIAIQEVTNKHLQRVDLTITAASAEYHGQSLTPLMYTWWFVQAASEGRWIIHDHQISDNPTMALTDLLLGFKRGSAQRSKVRRHHTLTWWEYNFLETFPGDIKFVKKALEQDDVSFQFYGDAVKPNFSKPEYSVLSTEELDLLEWNRQWALQVKEQKK